MFRADVAMLHPFGFLLSEAQDSTGALCEMLKRLVGLPQLITRNTDTGRDWIRIRRPFLQDIVKRLRGSRHDYLFADVVRRDVEFRQYLVSTSFHHTEESKKQVLSIDFCSTLLPGHIHCERQRLFRL